MNHPVRSRSDWYQWSGAHAHAPVVITAKGPPKRVANKCHTTPYIPGPTQGEPTGAGDAWSREIHCTCPDFPLVASLGP